MKKDEIQSLAHNLLETVPGNVMTPETYGSRWSERHAAFGCGLCQTGVPCEAENPLHLMD